jgi:hypothetical protein
MTYFPFLLRLISIINIKLQLLHHFWWGNSISLWQLHHWNCNQDTCQGKCQNYRYIQLLADIHYLRDDYNANILCNGWSLKGYISDLRWKQLSLNHVEEVVSNCDCEPIDEYPNWLNDKLRKLTVHRFFASKRDE